MRTFKAIISSLKVDIFKYGWEVMEYSHDIENEKYNIHFFNRRKNLIHHFQCGELYPNFCGYLEFKHLIIDELCKEILING